MQIIQEINLTEATIEDNVIKGVKILGRESKNGYTYQEQAVREAIPMYQGAPVCVNHVQPGKTHSFTDTLGFIDSPYLQGGDVMGNLVLNPHHNLTESVKWTAKNKINGVGLSQDVMAELTPDRKTVVRINRIKSIDLVQDAATTENLFESVQEKQPDPELVELKEQVKNLTVQLQEVVEQIKTKSKPQPIAISPPTEDQRESGYDQWISKIKTKRIHNA